MFTLSVILEDIYSKYKNITYIQFFPLHNKVTVAQRSTIILLTP